MLMSIPSIWWAGTWSSARSSRAAVDGSVQQAHGGVRLHGDPVGFPEGALAQLYHASASLPKDSDNGFRRWSGFELRGDLSGDLGAPLLHRLKTRELATMRLGLAVKLILGLVQVDFEAAGLRDVPRRVAKHLDAIAFGIVEIDRPGIAMADRSE